MDWATSLMVAVGAMFIFFAILLVVCYVLDSVLKMRVFRLFGTCSPGLAWVPWYSSYLLGRTCNGKDGQNLGIFGMSLPNWLWNFGWAIPMGCSVASMFIPVDFAGTILGYASFAFSFIWYSSVYAFLFSRLERKMEPEVRVIAIVSAIIGLVGVAKILSTPTTQVYSLENDEFPVEPKRGGFDDMFGGGQGGYDQGGYGQGYYDGGGFTSRFDIDH